MRVRMTWFHSLSTRSRKSPMFIISLHMKSIYASFTGIKNIVLLSPAGSLRGGSTQLTSQWLIKAIC